MRRELRGAIEGGVAGVAATVPMSAAMYVAKKLGLLGEYPPKIITKRSLRVLGAPPKTTTANDLVATVAHLGFGAMAGGIFGLIHERMDERVPAVVQGVGYGLLVYLASYQGWLPAVHLMPEPERDRIGRQPSMIAAHFVYGMVLGAIVGNVGRKRDR